MRKLTTDIFLEKLLLKYPNYEDTYKVVGDYVDAKTPIEVITDFGLCMCSPDKLLNRGAMPNIKSAVDKDSYFINKLIKSNELYRDLYKFNKLHYVGSTTPVIVTCKEHGDFTQYPHMLLRGHGCQKCSNRDLSLMMGEKALGWNLSTWVDRARVSKGFDSFKVYIVKMFNSFESFYKIGRTFLKTSDRLIRTPYKFEVVTEFVGDAAEVFRLEQDLHKLHKDYKYLPSMDFGGMHECYTSLLDEIKINNNLKAYVNI